MDNNLDNNQEDDQKGILKETKDQTIPKSEQKPTPKTIGNRGTELTAEDKKKIVELLKDNVSQREIAKKIKRGRTTINEFIKILDPKCHNLRLQLSSYWWGNRSFLE